MDAQSSQFGQRGATEVRFGSQVDMCGAKRHVRFTRFGPTADFRLIRQAVCPLASFARIERNRSGRYRMEDAVNLPSRIVDISSPLDNETVMDHPFMRPKIEYRTNAQNAPMLLE